MTQVGEGQGAGKATSAMTTYGTPTVGEVLAERYQLEEHINDDSAGRQVWRGVDVILRRPVAVILRYPGGSSAMEMLQAAVTASRVVHPNLVGVYDAIDEGERAYVVREWVDGAALREIVAAGPLDSERATTVAHAVAAAVAAVHSTGMLHGNIHPGTVLIGHDGRVVLADARADGTATPDGDARAVGGVLYFALTGYWPHAEVGRVNLPDAVRDSSGALASPRQNRAGVPDQLDQLIMDLLDPQVAPPSAEALAAELGRLDHAGDYRFFDDSGPLRYADEQVEQPRPAGRKIAIGVAALTVIALIGLLIGIPLLTGGDEDSPGQASPTGTAVPTGEATGGPTQGNNNPQALKIDKSGIRLVDFKGHGSSESSRTGLAADGDVNTGWETDEYNDNFPDSSFKKGIGLLVDLGAPHQLSTVKVELSDSGVTAELRAGTQDFGNSPSGDQKAIGKYTRIGEPIANSTASLNFNGFESEASYRYLVVWFTSLPQIGNGRHKIGVQEISVTGM